MYEDMTDLKPVIFKSFITPLLVVLFLSFIRWQYGVILFHTLAELFSVTVGILMMVVAWNTRRFTHNDFLVYLGIGYFMIAILDSWHTFTLKEMPFFDIDDSGVTLHFWINTRLIEALLLLTALIFLKRKLNVQLMIFFGAGLTLLVIWASLTLKEPIMITPEGLTAFKINAEYLIIFLLCIAFFAYIMLREYLTAKVLYFMLASLVLTIFAELSFTLYTDFEGLPFVIGHLFKFLSFWMIYQAIVRTTLLEPFSVLAKNSNSYIAIPHPAVVVDNQGMISQVNRAAEEHSGKQAQQLIHKPVHDFFHPSTLSEKNCELCTAIKQGRSLENHVVLFPEKQKWFLASLAPIRVGDRNSGMVQSLTDVTERIKIEKELILLKEKTEDNERKFKAITNQSNDGITVADPDGNYTFVNDTFCKMMGYSEEELLQMTVFDMKAPEQDTSSFDRSKSSEEGLPVQVLLQRKDGTTFTSEVIGKRIEINDQDLVLGTVRDITEDLQAEQSLIVNEEKFRSIFESAVVGIILVTGKNGCISEWNTGAERIFGYSSDEIIGKPLTILIPEKHLNAHNNGYMLATENGGILRQDKTHELRGLRKNNEEFPIQLTLSSWKSNGNLYFSATVLDITERKEQEEHILHQAHYDTLTDLPNRFLALDRLTQLINEAQRNTEKVAVLFLDLDDFKKVNDTLGHETGDKLLIEAADRLRNISRSCDTVGRLGGDEFIVLLGGLTMAADALPVTENLLNRFRDAFRIDGRELMLTTSLGIAIFPEDGDNASELLRKADSAMYHSKQLGRNTYSFFTDAMNRTASRRLALEEQIHGALERNEFTLLYQPQVDIANRKIIGVEALLRWHNPALGDISPVEFIPVAEQTGLIISIGQFVLVKAISMVAKWQRDFDPKIRVAVNLSPRQFHDPELVNFIEHAITVTGIQSETLELEITEGVLMSEDSYIEEALVAMSELGICISMDDFGTGYSSLSYLRNYPFNVLKIDRSFVSDITENLADSELINATIAMAHGLNLKVVAEGIETEEQLTYLKQLNCDYGQGYLFGKPMPAIKITELLKKQQ